MLRLTTRQIITEQVDVRDPTVGYEALSILEDEKEFSTVPYKEGSILINTGPRMDQEQEIEEPKGWQYDIKRWGSVFDLKLPTLPKLSDPDLQGIPESEFFKSGVGSSSIGDLHVKRITELLEINKRLWIPIVKNGNYFRHRTDFFFYSDHSIVQNIDRNDNLDNRNYLELSNVPRVETPILAASFERDSFTRTITYKDRFEQRVDFSGIYIGGEEQETVTAGGRILWDNVDPNKKEFIVDQNIDKVTRLFFNRDYYQTIGIDVSSYADLLTCEYIGTSTGSGHEIISGDELYFHSQLFYLKYLPIVATSVRLYVYDETTYEEWTRVDSWWDMVLSSQLNQYYIDEDLGILHVASQNPQHLPSIGQHLAVKYDYTLRVEYEDSSDNEDTEAWNADVNPITQTLNQGFVCITHENLDPASITLTINKQRIIGSTPPAYGPIYAGSDYASLKANVKNITGVNLANIPVTFTMVPTSLGYLNGSSHSMSVTNGEGNAFSSYQPPTSADSIGYYSTIVRNCTNPAYSSYREIVLTSLDPLLEGEEENIFTYQVLKDDILSGYKTVDDFLLEMYQEDTPAWVTDAETYIRWSEEMILKYDLRDFVEPSAENVSVAGRKVIIYQINGEDYHEADAIYPVTGSLGAAVPVKPILVEQISGLGDGTDGLWRLIYPAGAIPDCGPSEDIGAYWIVANKHVDFQAHCWSPYYNREIYSNIIRAKIALPDYMTGEYINSLGEKIPFGWKLVSDQDIVASALDGVIFITINPYSGPHEIIDLVNNTGGNDVWANAPFRTVGFQFLITEL